MVKRMVNPYTRTSSLYYIFLIFLFFYEHLMIKIMIDPVFIEVYNHIIISYFESLYIFTYGQFLLKIAKNHKKENFQNRPKIT